MNDFKLDSTKIASGFTTPDGFFDAFPQKVLPRLVPEKPVRGLFERSRVVIYAVAAVVVVALSIPILSPNATVTSLDDATIENYLAHQGGFGQFELVTLMDESDISAMDLGHSFDDQLLEDALSGENLEQYLIEQ